MDEHQPSVPDTSITWQEAVDAWRTLLDAARELRESGNQPECSPRGRSLRNEHPEQEKK